MSDSLNDLAAEHAALGSLIVRPEAAPEVLSIAQPVDFYGRNMELATLVAMLLDDGVTTWDPQIIYAEAKKRGFDKVADPVYLATLMERAWNPSSAAYYAKDVARAAARRELQRLGTRAVQQAASFESDLTFAVMELMQGAEELTTKLHAGEAAAPAPNVEDLLVGEVTFNWLVKGLLERGDRMIFTGYEGLGKVCGCGNSQCVSRRGCILSVTRLSRRARCCTSTWRTSGRSSAARTARWSRSRVSTRGAGTLIVSGSRSGRAGST